VFRGPPLCVRWRQDPAATNPANHVETQTYLNGATSTVGTSAARRLERVSE